MSKIKAMSDKMVRATMKIFLFGMCMVVLSGCLAYRISGYGDVHYTDTSPSRKYFISHLRLTGAGNLSAVFPHADKISAQDLLNAINAKRSDLFTHSEKDEPIDVEIRLGQTEVKDSWSCLVYIFSIGCLPLWNEYVSDHDVIVTFPSRGKNAPSATEKMRVSYSMRMTCYTPLGGIPYEDDPAAIVNVRKAPAFPGPGRDQSLLALSETVAKVLSSILQKDKGQPLLRQKQVQLQDTVVLPAAKIQKSTEPVQASDAVRDFFASPKKRTTCPECGAKLESSDKCPICGK